MLRLEARLYGHWGIPLLSSSKVHSLDGDWLLVQWMGILVCVYTGLLNMLQVQLLYQLFAVLFPGVWGTPIGGPPTGAEGIFGFCHTCVGCGPVSRPMLKKALFHTCPVVGRRTKCYRFGIGLLPILLFVCQLELLNRYVLFLLFILHIRVVTSTCMSAQKILLC